MQHSFIKYISLSIIFATLFSCNGNNSDSPHNQTTTTDTTSSANKVAIQFNADDAYNYIAKQVAFGPRVPGTEAQMNCAEWLQQMLQQSCDTVYRQQTTLTAGDKKTKLRCINLIGVINPKATYRILLLSHWDSRPWADQDVSNKDQPILAADDGASGVGVLIELANILKKNPLSVNIGIDILFTDVEDWGKSEWGDDSYALGTQYWAHNPHVKGYTANAGILLDMVGAAGARFPIEGISQQYAHQVITQVWDAAGIAGYGNYFVYDNGGTITDDHVPVNQIAHIPTIDIINLPADSRTGFGAHWHTHQDNMKIIDKNTLKAVGQTLVQYLFTLKP